LFPHSLGMEIKNQNQNHSLALKGRFFKRDVKLKRFCFRIL
jgi:hypothetical protein